MIFFKSDCVDPIIAAIKHVIPPVKRIKKLILSSEFIKGLNFITKNTPAVTIVAAWIKALTGVGPSIASGSHICSPICALFPITPIKSNIMIIVFNGLLDVLIEYEQLIRLISIDPIIFIIIPMAKRRAISPILLTAIALYALCAASSLVDQKFISKYEHTPTPSHPIKSCTRFGDNIRINIKNVNKLK